REVGATHLKFNVFSKSRRCGLSGANGTLQNNCATRDVAGAENREFDLVRPFAFNSGSDRYHFSFAAQFLLEFPKLLIEIVNVKTGINDEDIGAFSNRLLQGVLLVRLQRMP